MKRGSRSQAEHLERRDLLASISISQLPSTSLANDAHQLIQVSPPAGDADKAASYSAVLTAADGTPGLFPLAPRWESSVGSFRLDGALQFDVVPDDAEEVGEAIQVRLSVELLASGGTGAKVNGGETEFAYEVRFPGNETTPGLLSGGGTPVPYYEAPARPLTNTFVDEDETIIIETTVGESIIVEFDLDGEAQSWQDDATRSARGHLVTTVNVGAEVVTADAFVLPMESRDRFGYFTYRNTDTLSVRPDIGLYWSEDTIYQPDFDPPATPVKFGSQTIGTKEVTFVLPLEGWEDRFQHVLFVVDPKNKIAEADESNNSISVEVLANPVVAASVTPRNPTMSWPTHSHPFTFELDIENRSVVADNFTIQSSSEVTPNAPPNFENRDEVISEQTVNIAELNRFGTSQNFVSSVSLGGVEASWDWIDPQTPSFDALLDGEASSVFLSQLDNLTGSSQVLDQRSLADVVEAIGLGTDAFESYPSHELEYQVDIVSEIGADDRQVTLPITVEVDQATQTAFGAFTSQVAAAQSDLRLAMTAGLGTADGWVLLGNAVRHLDGAADYYQTALHRSDSSYMEVASPTTSSLDSIPDETSVLVKNAARALAESSAIQTALATSLARANGARTAGDAEWTVNQLMAASEFASAAAVHEAKVSGVQSLLGLSIGDRSRTTAGDLSQIEANDFAPEAINLLSEFGLDDAETAQLQDHILDAVRVGGRRRWRPDFYSPLAPANSTSLASSSQHALLSSALLVEAIETRSGELAASAQAIDYLAAERFQLRLTDIETRLDSGAASKELLTTIEELIADVRHEIDETNNVGYVQFFEQAHQSLVAFQAISVAPESLIRSIDSFVAAGDIAEEVATPLRESANAVNDALVAGQANEALANTESYLASVRQNWGRSIPFSVAAELDGQAAYFRELLLEETPERPTATDDTGHAELGQTVFFDVLANDKSDSGEFKIIAVSEPDFGTATIDDNGTPDVTSDDRIAYTANAEFRGIDSLKYVLESDGLTSTAEVHVMEAMPFGEAFDVRQGVGRTLMFSVEESAPVFLDVLNGDSHGSILLLRAPSGNPVQFFAAEHPVRLQETGTYSLEFYPPANANPDAIEQFRFTNLAALPLIDIGQTVSGSVATESAFFRFNGSNFDRRVFESVAIQESSSATWRAFGPQLNLADFETRSLGSDFEFVFESVAEHYLQIENPEAEILEFEFRMTVPPTTNETIDFGDIVTGQLVLGERHIYELDGQRNDQIFFDSLQATSGVVWQLNDPEGNESMDEQPVEIDSTRVFTLPTGGKYELQVSGTGDYDFRLLNAHSQPTLPIGSSTAVMLNEESDALGFEARIYNTDGIESDQLILLSESLNGPSDVEAGWSLFYANEDIVPLPLETSFSRELTGRGNPILILTSQSADEVEFTFEAQIEPTRTETDLTVGQTVVGSLTVPLEQQTYSFEASAGQLLYFDSLSEASLSEPLLSDDPADATSSAIVAEVITPSGERTITTTADDDEPFATTEDGRYRINIYAQSDFANADYSFVLRDLTAAATQIEFGESVTGMLLGQSGSNAFRVAASQDDRLVFLPTEADPMAEEPITAVTWTLYGSDGQRISRQQTLNDSFAVTVPSDGDYFLLLENQSQSDQAYEFVANRNEIEATNIRFGETVAAELSEFGEMHRYTLEATGGDWLLFDSFDSDDENLIVTITSPSGMPVLSDISANADAPPILLSEAGTYRIDVFGFVGATGDYAFELADLSDVPAIEVGASVSGTLMLTAGTGSDLEFHRVSVQTHEKIVLSSVSDGTRAQWRAYDEMGNEVASEAFADDLLLPVDAAARDYLVVLDAQAGNGTQFPSEQPYEFLALAAGADVQSLELGAEVSDRFSDAADRDRYTFAGTEGQRIYFDWLRELIYNVQIVSPSGTVLADDLVTEDIGPLTLPETGDYVVSLDPLAESGSVSTDYRFRIVDLAQLPKITEDTDLQGMANFVDAELFVVTSTANRVLEFQDRLDGGITWQVFDSEDTLVSERVGSSRLALEASGEYLLRFSPAAGREQAYYVRLEFVDELFGDLNFDGHVGIPDIDVLSAALRSGSKRSQFDLNEDGLVDDADYDFMLSEMVGTIRGDFNLNGRVEFADFLLLATNFGQEGGWREGDFDGDGIVSENDFFLLRDNFGASVDDESA